MENQQEKDSCNKFIKEFKICTNKNKDDKEKCENLKNKIKEICDMEIFPQLIDM